jgi:hypothetical protein
LFGPEDCLRHSHVVEKSPKTGHEEE